MEELEEIKSKIQRLSGLEKSVENITQTMAKILYSREDTQKTVAILINPKFGMNTNLKGEGSGSITKGQVPLQHGLLF